MNLAQFLLILRARKWVVIAVTVTLFAVAMVITALMPRQYSASASIVIDAKGVDPISGQPMQVMLLPSFMATQVDIISSDRVATRVIKLLKLDEVPQFREKWERQTEGRGSYQKWLIDEVLAKLDVKPARESNVLDINYKWPDPKYAALFANAFAQAYLDTSVELRVEPARQYASFFTERSKAVRAELEEAQKKLSDYQREHGITAIDERMDVENSRLNELSSQLVAVQAQRVESQSRQRQAVNKDALPEVLQNPLISSLKAELARAESQREDIVRRLGRNHPDYQRNEGDISQMRERIAQETARIVNSVGTGNQVNIQRESEITASMEAQKKKLLELKNQRDTLTVLQNDVQTAQRSLEAINQRLTQTSLESQVQQNNVAVLNSAFEPIDPSSPRVFLNVVLSLVIGATLGVGAALLLEFSDKRVRSAQDLKDLLGVPMLGALGKQVPQAAAGWWSQLFSRKARA
ncbi:chain length determinant protein EpsF [Viridibacterium curvum]|uniref:Chain length determinant protein EpsF n=1 Tax=Viridibacterium curvum TaxID=1101404 RepID=A0ABP9QZT3_9RHOO